MALHLRWERGKRFVKMYGSVVVQKTKVELMSSPSLRKFACVELSASRRCSNLQTHGRRAKISWVECRPFSGVVPRSNFGLRSLFSDRFASVHGGGLFARLSMCSSRLKSGSSQTGRQSADFSREWKERISDSYFVLAVLALTGVAVYVIYRYKYGATSPATSLQTGADYSLCSTQLKLNKGKPLSLQDAIADASDLCQRVKDETGSPGLVVAVSVDGRQVWAQGFGYSDVENRLPCKPETVIRIASISKSITMTAVAKAMENGKLDLDKAVQVYVPKFPEKTVNGEKVTLTTRQLVSHMSGIRHYDKDYMNNNSKSAPPSPTTTTTTTKHPDSKEKASSPAVDPEFEYKEYYIKDKYETTEAALALFKDDPLVHKPGSKYLYSSHAWTLVAAVLEGATNTKFPVLMRRLFRDLGLENTYLDENEPLIYNRSRNYVRNKNGLLVNAPFIDCSYKYAGGGMLSTMPDLLQFANAMLYSFQFTETSCGTEKESKAAAIVITTTTTIGADENDQRNHPTQTSPTPSPPCPPKQLPGYLRSPTVSQLWTAVPAAKEVEWEDVFYGMGWGVMPGSSAPPVGFGGNHPMYVLHTGGAVGASSVLLILPATVGEGSGGGDGGLHFSTPSSSSSSSSSLPRGVCVAMAVNLVSVSLRRTALQIAQVFAQVLDDI